MIHVKKILKIKNKTVWLYDGKNGKMRSLTGLPKGHRFNLWTRYNVTIWPYPITFPTCWCVLHNHLHTPICFFPPFTESCHNCIFFLCMDDRNISLISWNFLKHKLDGFRKKKKMLLFTRISWSSSSSHSSGSFPHLSLVFWGNTHHQHSPWMKRFSINQLTPDLRSNQVISLLLFSRSFSLSTDKSPHTKSDSLFQFINNARLLFISSTSTDWFETDWFCSV